MNLRRTNVTRETVKHQVRKSVRASLVAAVATAAGALGAGCGSGQVRVVATVPTSPPPVVATTTTVVAPPPPQGCPGLAEYAGVSSRAELTLNYNAPSNFGGGA